mmetsp:Transcript_37127/g.109513  ORF Transcript_37127/g.109513 Transcript_37127/m.109513 type:complete len:204 (+) Transcript_37127:329-940(+)
MDVLTWCCWAAPCRAMRGACTPPASPMLHPCMPALFMRRRLLLLLLLLLLLFCCCCYFAAAFAVCADAICAADAADVSAVSARPSASGHQPAATAPANSEAAQIMSAAATTAAAAAAPTASASHTAPAPVSAPRGVGLSAPHAVAAVAAAAAGARVRPRSHGADGRTGWRARCSARLGAAKVARRPTAPCRSAGRVVIAAARC